MIEKIPAKVITLGTDYNGIGKLQYISGNMGLATLDTRYTEAVEMDIIVPLEDVETFKSKVTEATNARCKISEGEDCYYGMVDNKPIIFDK